MYFNFCVLWVLITGFAYISCDIRTLHVEYASLKQAGKIGNLSFNDFKVQKFRDNHSLTDIKKTFLTNHEENNRYRPNNYDTMPEDKNNNFINDDHSRHGYSENVRKHSINARNFNIDRVYGGTGENNETVTMSNISKLYANCYAIKFDNSYCKNLITEVVTKFQNETFTPKTLQDYVLFASYGLYFWGTNQSVYDEIFQNTSRVLEKYINSDKDTTFILYKKTDLSPLEKLFYHINDLYYRYLDTTSNVENHFTILEMLNTNFYKWGLNYRELFRIALSTYSHIHYKSNSINFKNRVNLAALNLLNIACDHPFSINNCLELKRLFYVYYHINGNEDNKKFFGVEDISITRKEILKDVVQLNLPDFSNFNITLFYNKKTRYDLNIIKKHIVEIFGHMENYVTQLELTEKYQNTPYVIHHYLFDNLEAYVDYKRFWHLYGTDGGVTIPYLYDEFGNIDLNNEGTSSFTYIRDSFLFNFKHEMQHNLLNMLHYNRMQWLPTWFVEGSAEYFAYEQCDFCPETLSYFNDFTLNITKILNSDYDTEYSPYRHGMFFFNFIYSTRFPLIKKMFQLIESFENSDGVELKDLKTSIYQLFSPLEAEFNNWFLFNINRSKERALYIKQYTEGVKFPTTINDTIYILFADNEVFKINKIIYSTYLPSGITLDAFLNNYSKYKSSHGFRPQTKSSIFWLNHSFLINIHYKQFINAGLTKEDAERTLKHIYQKDNFKNKIVKMRVNNKILNENDTLSYIYKLNSKKIVSKIININLYDYSLENYNSIIHRIVEHLKTCKQILIHYPPLPTLNNNLKTLIYNIISGHGLKKSVLLNLSNKYLYAIDNKKNTLLGLIKKYYDENFNKKNLICYDRFFARLNKDNDKELTRNCTKNGFFSNTLKYIYECMIFKNDEAPKFNNNYYMRIYKKGLIDGHNLKF